MFAGNVKPLSVRNAWKGFVSTDAKVPSVKSALRDNAMFSAGLLNVRYATDPVRAKQPVP